MPEILQTGGGLIVLVILVGLFWFTFRKRSRNTTLVMARNPAFSCEWVSHSLTRAKEDFHRRFPELDRIVADHPPKRVHLIRFGIFNESEDAFEAAAMTVPVTVLFEEGDAVLSIVCAEQEKAEAGLPEVIAGKSGAPQIDVPQIGAPGGVAGEGSNRAILPPFRMAGRSSIILNLIVLGEGRITGLAGQVEDLGDLRRVR